MNSGEFAFLSRLARRIDTAGARDGEVFVGDDAAVVLPPGRRLLFATDLVVEGVHFDRALGSLADAGWKSVAVNVSDVAAMGGEALYAVAGVSGPPDTDLDDLLDGMLEAAERFGVRLVGGDLSSGDNVVMSVAVLGECAPAGPVLRSGARAGEEIWLTGPLGASAAGLRALRSGEQAADGGSLAQAYLRPIARQQEGQLAAELGASAMIDISDGLAADLGHLADASGVGVRLDDVPVVPGALEEDALSGGEDYELLFTVARSAPVVERFAAAGLRTPMPIGQCTGEPHERLLRGAVFEPVGFEHRFGAAGGGG